jgi:hypothetical protein
VSQPSARGEDARLRRVLIPLDAEEAMRALSRLQYWSERELDADVARGKPRPEAD